MGQGTIKAPHNEIISLAHDWAQEHGLAWNDSTPSDKHASGYYCFVKWGIDSEENGVTLDMSISLKPWLSYLVYGVLLSSLGLSIGLLLELLRNFTIPKTLVFIVVAIFILLVFYWKDQVLVRKLSRLEGTFWKTVKLRYDVRQVTRAGTQTYTRKFRFVKESLLVVGAISILWAFLGYWGALIGLFLCVPILIMINVEIIRGDSPNWHWRLWIIENMAQWTFLMIAMLAFVPVMGAFDVFMNLEMYNTDNPPSIHQVIQDMKLRSIPSYSEQLEADINRRLLDLARPKAMSDEEWQKKGTGYLYGCSAFILAILLIAIFYFIFRPIKNLLRNQERWVNEADGREAGNGPYVPYLPGASRWKYPSLLRGVIVFHYLFGGILNCAAVILCFDGYSYALTGRTILFRQAANLWSWLFGPCKILFGNTAGWVVGVVLLSLISLPILMAIGAYLRRALGYGCLATRIVCRRVPKDVSYNQNCGEIERFINHASQQLHVKKPILWITNDTAVVVQLHWFPIMANSVIEISHGTVSLLDSDELQAVIAHEIGHIQQGLWKVGILKFLSSVAFFPNHYLTLCMNWSSMEMNADKIALRLIKNPNSLKQALVKISMAQSMYLRQRFGKQNPANPVHGIGHWVKSRLRIRYSAIRFYFGDALFGYAHPYLSERLKALENAS